MSEIDHCKTLKAMKNDYERRYNRKMFLALYENNLDFLSSILFFPIRMKTCDQVPTLLGTKFAQFGQCANYLPVDNL